MLFSDASGCTELAEGLDPEVMRGNPDRGRRLAEAHSSLSRDLVIEALIEAQCPGWAAGAHLASAKLARTLLAGT